LYPQLVCAGPSSCPFSRVTKLSRYASPPNALSRYYEASPSSWRINPSPLLEIDLLSDFLIAPRFFFAMAGTLFFFPFTSLYTVSGDFHFHFGSPGSRKLFWVFFVALLQVLYHSIVGSDRRLKFLRLIVFPLRLSTGLYSGPLLLQPF